MDKRNIDYRIIVSLAIQLLSTTKKGIVTYNCFLFDRLVFFLVDNLGIHLGHLHIGMAEQFRGCVSVKRVLTLSSIRIRRIL